MRQPDRREQFGVTPPGRWRIDDLAQRAGLTVDTIRFYQREGLLPPAERSGRAKVYGPTHLERLGRIRELQERRFSLAAIRALLDADRPGMIEGIFGSGGAEYDLDALVERSGIEVELFPWFAERWEAAGGPRHCRPAYAFFHGGLDEPRYDLEQRRWCEVAEVWPEDA